MNVVTHVASDGSEKTTYITDVPLTLDSGDTIKVPLHRGDLLTRVFYRYSRGVEKATLHVAVTGYPKDKDCSQWNREMYNFLIHSVANNVRNVLRLEARDLSSGSHVIHRAVQQRALVLVAKSQLCMKLFRRASVFVLPRK